MAADSGRDRVAVILGCGYVGRALARALVVRGWQVTGTGRSQGSLAAIEAAGARALTLDDPALEHPLAGAAVLVGSIPPGPDGDPALLRHADLLASRPPAWAGYLSTTGAYGDRGGRWAFEEDPPTPQSPEAVRRVTAEAQWQAPPFGACVFRLPGIYGPGRSAIDQVRAGTARSIVRPGQLFSRIHRDDIVPAVLAAIDRSCRGRIYNLCDDLPAPSHCVTQAACRLLGVEPPEPVPVERAGLSPMGLRFWSECKRVANGRAKAELGWRPAYPTYREGLAACLEQCADSLAPPAPAT